MADECFHIRHLLIPCVLYDLRPTLKYLFLTHWLLSQHIKVYQSVENQGLTCCVCWDVTIIVCRGGIWSDSEVCEKRGDDPGRLRFEGNSITSSWCGEINMYDSWILWEAGWLIYSCIWVVTMAVCLLLALVSEWIFLRYWKKILKLPVAGSDYSSWW